MKSKINRKLNKFKKNGEINIQKQHRAEVKVTISDRKGFMDADRYSPIHLSLSVSIYLSMYLFVYPSINKDLIIAIIYAILIIIHLL